MPEKFTFEIEHGKHGLWYATSHDIRGLLVADGTLEGVLGAIPQALEDLSKAKGKDGT